MTKKKSKSAVSAAKKLGSEVDGTKIVRADARQQLLARVAGDVASGIVCSPSESTSTAEGIAAVAVDIAEEILKKAGL